jgi:peptide-methionine (R)-S-oxide reductase
LFIVEKSEDEWKSTLTPNQFSVLRLKATEPPGFSERSPGELEYELKRKLGTKYPKSGSYECVGCGTVLYTAKSKFDSGCGWPAFYEVRLADVSLSTAIRLITTFHF